MGTDSCPHRKHFSQHKPLSHKFKLLTALEAEKHDLPEDQIVDMILNFCNIFSRKPANIPDCWKLKWCKRYLAPRYDNPNDNMEYIVVVPHINRGFLPYVIHHTSNGYADPQWFYEIVPQLENIAKDPRCGRPFSFKFNESVNEIFGNEMTQGQIQAINLFFEKFVPGIEGICTTCFNVSLPISGAGERWVHRQKDDNEVRLSAAKPKGLPGQTVEYVSHTELDRNGNEIFAFWNKQENKKGFSNYMEQEDTHIPWDVYDFNKFSMNMPVCTCK